MSRYSLGGTRALTFSTGARICVLLLFAGSVVGQFESGGRLCGLRCGGQKTRGPYKKRSQAG